MSAGRFDLAYRPDGRWLHRKLDRARYLLLLRYCAVALVLLAALVLAAWPRLEAVRLGYRVEQLRLERDRLEKDIQRYRLEWSQLTDPRRVERAGRESHGLEPPEEFVVLEVTGAGAAPPPGSDTPPADSPGGGASSGSGAGER